MKSLYSGNIAIQQLRKLKFTLGRLSTENFMSVSIPNFTEFQSSKSQNPTKTPKHLTPALTVVTASPSFFLSHQDLHGLTRLRGVDPPGRRQREDDREEGEEYGDGGEVQGLWRGRGLIDGGNDGNKVGRIRRMRRIGTESVPQAKKLFHKAGFDEE
ncbi:hypothetical protein L484_012002 [Morus notabilis]|uniref:Uncharacterized protein n=1 Tax=Morus notabilis TaxID=981085 RepID=W9RSF8_9ROSA|nr:hypothetical protein L484_012002 [Morus notabilis]